MNDKVSEWNGYPVYGDIRELNYIVNADGLIKLEKADIISVLSAEGKNCLTSSINANLGEAFNEAINRLPNKIDKVNSLLIDFRCGNNQPTMSDLSSISASLSKANPDIQVK